MGKTGSNSLVENTGSVSAIFIESLIDDIPCVALSLVVSDHFFDVILHNRNKSFIRPSTPRNYQIVNVCHNANEARLTYPRMATASTKPKYGISTSANWPPQKQ